MSRSTFNGPVLVGVDNAFHKEGIHLGGFNLREGPDWGFINMSQSAAIEEISGVSNPRWVGIIIPYKSVITKVSLLITTAWGTLGSPNGVHGTIGVAWGTVPAVNTVLSDDIDIDELTYGVDLMTVGNHALDPTLRASDHAAETHGTGSASLTGVDTVPLRVGMMIRDGNGYVGVEVAGQTFIQSIDTATTLTMTKNAISDGVTTLDFLGIPPNDIGTWMNVGSKHAGSELPSTDRMITFEEIQGSGTAGRGVLTVNYAQAVDLSAIAS